MRNVKVLAGCLWLAASAVTQAGGDVAPLQLFGTEGRYEFTPRGDILLYPDSDVSVLHEAPLTFAVSPDGSGAERQRLYALPDAANEALAARIESAPVPGPFRAHRYRFAPRFMGSAEGYGPPFGYGHPPIHGWPPGQFQDPPMGVAPPGFRQGW